jgi:hypothetical protein
MVAAQCFAALRREVPDLQAQVAGGNCRPIGDWLAPRIWQQGARHDLDAMLQTLSAHWPDHTPPAKLDYRLGELRLTDVPANTLQTLSQVPWPELGYQFRMDGSQAVLRTEAKP